MTDKHQSTIDVELSTLSAIDRYKILCAVVVPRPIAWVTTVNTDGQVNAAPFSFFNVFSEDPPLVVLGLQHHADGSYKDTTRNIHATGEFVVNLCDESLAAAMNDCAIDFPADVSEPERLNLAVADSSVVAPPRIADAPFALECRREVSLAFGPGRELLVGEPLQVHARAGLLDPTNWHVDFEAYQPVGRLFGELYSRQSDVFSMRRETVDEYMQRTKTADQSD